MRRAKLIAIGLSIPLLAGCVPADFDFDMRPERISTRGAGEAAPRPAPDANGLITYDSYQMVVARRGDTVADVAARIGMQPEELARFNGRNPSDVLRPDEVLALPRRVDPGAPTATGTDITAIASSAIAAAEARSPVGATTATSLAVQPGQEPVRHRIARGETAYSIARLYNVSVRSLAEWNGLGPDLAVREGQFLIIPIVLDESAADAVVATAAPGASVAPLPPSAATPLPEPIQAAPLPQQTSAAPVAAPPPAAQPAPAPQPTSTARFTQPVAGDIIRPYGRGNEGIDIAAPSGTAVRAAGDGEVAAITQSTDQIPILVVRHPDGLMTIYANISNIAVARGDRVTQGQKLAEVGAGSPSFLHFEVRRGFEALDPTQFLP
ncbi:peptidoglycan DD-metalloendopeptidase family protein [Roseicyclus sp.]|uniref:peptidoglycan DD-metalloendopeptidase family protein n=1 Tax=Roseicyclus sp. TaxID=1914329 RepID=UPI001BCB43FA|nr:peptidoglycan DD-metalloendopeptidase family protein [Roseicyclus sp.]